MTPLKVITLFSGYDSQCLALNRLGVPYECVRWCEIDKHAIKAHNALFPQWADRNLGDVSKVDWSTVPGPIDLLTYSSPCQDFSQAGLQRGGEKGSGTRSGLLWECERAIEALRPRYLVFENVPALVSEKFMPTFMAWAKVLAGLGYRNYWQCLNAKHYGVPQNRNRVFMVSIHGEGQQFFWPKPFKLERRLKDVLEQEVDERYYLSDAAVNRLTNNIEKCGGDKQLATDTEGTARTICASLAKLTTFDNYVEVQDAAILTPIRSDEQKAARRQGMDCKFGERPKQPRTDGVSNTLTSVAKDNLLLEPTIIQDWMSYGDGPRYYKDYSPTLESERTGLKVMIKQATKEGYVEVPEGAVFDGSYPNSETRRGRVQDGGEVSPTVTAESNGLLTYRKHHQQDDIQSEDGLSRTLVVGSHGNSSHFTKTAVTTPIGIRIRRLTERELFRLMDVDDTDIDTLLSAGIAKTQLAKMAGNSIVVAVLYHIFNRLLIETQPQRGEQMALF